MPRKTRAQKQKAKERFLKSVYIDTKTKGNDQPPERSSASVAFRSDVQLSAVNKNDSAEPRLSAFFMRDLTKSLIVSVAVISLIIILFFINK